MHRCALCPSGGFQVGDGRGWGTSRRAKGGIRRAGASRCARSGWVNKADFPRGLGRGCPGPEVGGRAGKVKRGGLRWKTAPRSKDPPALIVAVGRGREKAGEGEGPGKGIRTEN